MTTNRFILNRLATLIDLVSCTINAIPKSRFAPNQKDSLNRILLEVNVNLKKALNIAKGK